MVFVVPACQAGRTTLQIADLVDFAPTVLLLLGVGPKAWRADHRRQRRGTTGAGESQFPSARPLRSQRSCRAGRPPPSATRTRSRTPVPSDGARGAIGTRSPRYRTPSAHPAGDRGGAPGQPAHVRRGHWRSNAAKRSAVMPTLQRRTPPPDDSPSKRRCGARLDHAQVLRPAPEARLPIAGTAAASALHQPRRAVRNLDLTKHGWLNSAPPTA